MDVRISRIFTRFARILPPLHAQSVQIACKSVKSVHPSPPIPFLSCTEIFDVSLKTIKIVIS
ncbi:MAG: hypothetical protein RL329_3412 [Bacteroidota bacterium]|jgi:hypothetical protein